MEIRFNLTGTERKALVTAVSEITNQPPQYLGAPSFAYRVGDYHIDKNGTLTGDCTPEFLSGLEQKGYTLPNEKHATSRVVDAQERAEADTLIIEMPKDGFTDAGIANLEKIIAGKAALIKKALGVENLTIEQTDDSIKFPWFNPQGDAALTRAYSQFIAALCRAAKTQKRVTAKEKDVDNEKYAFRCFLLRLGFIGDEYKDARKKLLANLSGDNSYRDKEHRRRRSEIYGGQNGQEAQA